MKTFNLYSLDGWKPFPIGQDVAFETGEDVRNIEVTFNASGYIEVWAVDPDDEPGAVLVAAADGMFVAKLALPAGMCLRVDCDQGVAVFARSAARSQVMPASCEPSLTRPMPPRSQVDPRVRAMMETMRRNEVQRQQAFESMLARAAPGPAAAPEPAVASEPAPAPAGAGDAS